MKNFRQSNDTALKYSSPYSSSFNVTILATVE